MNKTLSHAEDLKQHYESILDSMNESFFLVDDEGRIHSPNKAALRLFGYTYEEFCELSIEDLIPERFRKHHVAQRKHYFDHPEPRTMGMGIEIKALHKDGHEFTMEISLGKKSKPTTPFVSVLGVDISHRKEIEKQLKESEERLSLVIEGSNEGIWDWNVQNNEMFLSERWKELLGFHNDELPNNFDTWLTHLHPDDLNLFNKATKEHLKHQSTFSHQFRLRHKNSKYLWFLVRGLSIANENNKVTRMAGSITNITEQKEYEFLLSYQAAHDPLTGLSNRMVLSENIEQNIRYAHRDKQELVVMFMDIDRFKVVNDSLGHNIGDKLIKKVTQRLHSQCRECDVLIRYGGDEFVLLMIIKSLDELSIIVDKLIRIHEQPLKIETHTLRVTMSIGVTTVNTSGSSPETLLRHADSAMFEAKKRGGNTFHVYSKQLNKLVEKNLTISMGLHEALKNNEYFLQYQPKISLKTGKVDSFEALIRWKYKNNQIIPPNDFIPIAEETRFILPLGNWINKAASEQAKLLINKGLFAGRIAINISTIQLESEEFISSLRHQIKHQAIYPNCLELEITETAFLKQPDKIIDLLHELKSYGFTLALDDFGTGFSSLSWLAKFPYDTLKLDQSFMSKALIENKYKTIVKNTLSLAQELNLKTVAEGVENEQQVDFLLENNCDLVQGYYYSRPLDADVLSKHDIFRKNFLKA